MTDETCVVVIQTMRELATGEPGRFYKCFYICGPDGVCHYAGGSYTGARMLAKSNWPGYPVIDGYKRTAPVLGRRFRHEPFNPVGLDWEDLFPLDGPHLPVGKKLETCIQPVPLDFALMYTEAYEQTRQQIAIGPGIPPEVMETHAGRRIATHE